MLSFYLLLLSAFAYTDEEYLRHLSQRVRQIPEFEVIREWAQSHNLHVWLGGGTATGIASYVHEELKDEGKNKERFPYTYYDIYRSTQDADIVLDGNESDALALEQLLREKLSYLQGSKKLWEVRLLRHSRGTGVGEKAPLIGSRDFRDQNSDSYSTGLIEITAPINGESQVRDTFDWTNQTHSQFLIDLKNQELTFYRNPNHKNTARAQAGYNPEIVSVVRALIKSFQYNATIKSESLKLMRQIIDEFDPQSDLSQTAIKYINRNANKLYQHARDLEHAQLLMDQIGIRKKLIQFSSKYDQKLMTLLQREPLKSYPLGQGNDFTDVKCESPGKTASELGIDVVSHETNSFLAYESITMSRLGKPNLFISRTDTPEEAAAYGWGVYTQKGRQGARGTKLTIRFKMNPLAVSCRDFFVAGSFVIVRNANAMTVIPEDRIPITLKAFLELLDEGKFSQDDIGVMKKLELKVLGDIHKFGESEIEEIFDQIMNGLKSDVGTKKASFNYFLKLASVDSRLKYNLVKHVFQNSSISHEQKVELFAAHQLLDELVSEYIKNGDRMMIAEVILKKITDNKQSESYLMQTYFKTIKSITNGSNRLEHEKIMRKLIKLGRKIEYNKNSRSLCVWTEWVLFLIEQGYEREAIGVVHQKLVSSKEIRDYDYKKNQSKDYDTHYYKYFNEYLMKLENIPANYLTEALSLRNPEHEKWFRKMMVLPGQAVKQLEKLSQYHLNGKNTYEYILISFQLWRDAFLEAKKESEIRAKEIAIKFLEKQDHSYGFEYPKLVPFLIEQGYEREAIGVVHQKLVSSKEIRDYDYKKNLSKDYDTHYYKYFNDYLERAAEIPYHFKREALWERNPDRARFLNKPIGKPRSFCIRFLLGKWFSASN